MPAFPCPACVTEEARRDCRKSPDAVRTGRKKGRKRIGIRLFFFGPGSRRGRQEPVRAMRMKQREVDFSEEIRHFLSFCRPDADPTVGCRSLQPWLWVRIEFLKKKKKSPSFPDCRRFRSWMDWHFEKSNSVSCIRHRRIVHQSPGSQRLFTARHGGGHQARARRAARLSSLVGCSSGTYAAAAVCCLSCSDAVVSHIRFSSLGFHA